MVDWKSALAALRATEEYNDNNKTDNERKVLEKGEQNNASIDSVEQKEARVKTKKRVGVVYSTNPDFEYHDDSQEVIDTLPKNQQKLRLSMERAGRGGKTVTIVKGFIGTEEDINALCKLLKQKCGVGGSVIFANKTKFDGEPTDDGRRESQILIQGDNRQRLIEILKKEGYTQTK